MKMTDHLLQEKSCFKTERNKDNLQYEWPFKLGNNNHEKQDDPYMKFFGKTCSMREDVLFSHAKSSPLAILWLV